MHTRLVRLNVVERGRWNEMICPSLSTRNQFGSCTRARRSRYGLLESRSADCGPAAAVVIKPRKYNNFLLFNVICVCVCVLLCARYNIIVQYNIIIIIIIMETIYIYIYIVVHEFHVKEWLLQHVCVCVTHTGYRVVGSSLPNSIPLLLLYP